MAIGELYLQNTDYPETRAPAVPVYTAVPHLAKTPGRVLESIATKICNLLFTILWCATSRRQHQIPTIAVRVGADIVTPTTSVRDLGIFIDSDLSMRTQVTRTVAGCFADPVFQSLVVSLVLTKLDYGNATLTGLPSPAAVGT